LDKKEATRFAQDATVLFSLFLLTSFELLCIAGTHSLFGIFGVSMRKSLFCIYLCHTMDFSSFVYLSHRACFGALLNLRTHTNPLTVVTLVQCFTTLEKATLNRIGTQRKKRGYKGGASYTYAKVRRCQNTQLAAMSMKVESKD
jgi:hypothetical protein